jgi:hypothetical protein
MINVGQSLNRIKVSTRMGYRPHGTRSFKESSEKNYRMMILVASERNRKSYFVSVRSVEGLDIWNLLSWIQLTTMMF